MSGRTAVRRKKGKGAPPRARTARTAASPRGRTPRRVRTPRVLVVRAAGTNCDRETAFAFGQAGAETVTVHANALLARPALLADVHGLAIPGGFSHGDDLGAGTIFGARIRARLVDAIRRLVDRGGVVLGVCNGFQVLVKTGLVPGFDGKTERTVTLTSNESHRYEDRWVTLEVTTDRCAFLRKGERYEVPVAHAEGRLLPASDAVLRRLHADGQVALRYVNPAAPAGSRAPAGYPFNPNGAVDDIAGITDPTGRILGLMPHPERCQFPWHSPRFHLHNTVPGSPSPAPLPDGLRLFQHAVSSLRGA
jgi:phosphoribosylformylglycinamidine synthase subunit PurQ / glutaminase